ncbi:olfactory receptor 1-like [Pseudophryne corroboree]|uniref:olfactory receptor 1-like n=1 Tax=Pseudophryne corroboree TaxID=495146 RepID=UPI0030814EAE
MYFHAMAGTTEDVIILIMAYDRYVAICDPLHYHYILNRKNCLLFVSGTWISGCLNAFVFTFPVSRMSFCQSPIIHQFFCDVKALFSIACAGSEDYFIVICMELLLFGVFPIMLSVTSYLKMIRVILQIKSKDGRKNAFSTCSSHLIIIIMYCMTALGAYMMPPSKYSSVLEPVFTALYAVVTPTINPLIYSLRNKVVKKALRKILSVKVLNCK